MIKNSFDRVTWIYDGLANLVFFGAIKRAQLTFLSTIKSGSKVLIIGGGTGWILEALDKIGIAAHVDYLEASSKMLEKSKSRPPFENLQVRFILGTQDSIEKNIQYDVVITHFFLDVFTSQNLPLVMNKLDQHLKPNGFWLMTDFMNNNRWWQSALIRLMYLFFRITANLEGSRLMNFDNQFSRLTYSLARKKDYFHGMISSRQYVKP